MDSKYHVTKLRVQISIMGEPKVATNFRLTHGANPASNAGRPSQRLRTAVQNPLLRHQTLPFPGNPPRPAFKHVPGGWPCRRVDS